MLLFSRNSSNANNGSSRDVTKVSSNKNGRNSYYEQQPSAKSSSVALNVTSVTKKVVVEDDEATFLKRSSNRSTMKKSRPHSWHSTLQRGFQRARSRSSGRGERNRAAAANSTAPTNGQKQNGKTNV